MSRTLYPKLVGATDRGLSPDLWRNMPLDEIFSRSPNKLGVGVGVFDDFDSWDSATDTAASTVRYGSGGVRMYNTAVTLPTAKCLKYDNSLASSGAHGVLRISTTASDNDEVVLQWCGDLGAPFAFDNTTYAAGQDVGRDLAFECRFRTNTITLDQLAFFVGLAEETSAAANFLAADTGVLADKDFIGFSRLQANGTQATFTYKTAGQTVQAGGTGEGGVTAFHTMVADTWVKMGLRYDAKLETVTAYLNGVANTTKITKTQTGAATFPNAQGLAPIIAAKCGTAAIYTMDIDWICCAQVEQQLR